MAKKNNVAYIQGNPDSVFFGVFITVDMNKKKLTKVQFTLKGSDLKPGMGGLTIGEFKNYKAIIEKLKTQNQRLKNEKDDLIDDLVTLANAEWTFVNSAVVLQDEFRDVLDKHGIDWDQADYEDDEDWDEDQ